jgi:flagellar basal body-associated protein FliL
VYRVLLGLLILLVLGFLAGTAYGLLRKPARAAETGGTESIPVKNGSQTMQTGDSTGDKPDSAPTGPAFFTGIGRIRAATADPEPATVIVSIAFPYDRTDLAFSEELAARTKDLRELTADLFSNLGADELQAGSEEKLKAELLRRYNAILRLGKISVIYFNDYLLVD